MWPYFSGRNESELNNSNTANLLQPDHTPSPGESQFSLTLADDSIKARLQIKEVSIL